MANVQLTSRDEIRRKASSTTRLLVSVRSLEECHQIIDAAVDILDIKEPSRGSLGRCDSTTIRQILDLVAGRFAVSAALGELLECDRTTLADTPASLAYAKFGLAGCGKRRDWHNVWAEAWKMLPDKTQRVAVYYADHQRAQAPPWHEVIEHGQTLACRILLVDTFDKSSGSLLQVLSLSELAELIRDARDGNMQVALAGSIDLPILSQVLSLSPDVIAVRGAVCRGGREGIIDANAVAHFRRSMQPSSSVGSSARPRPDRVPPQA